MRIDGKEKTGLSRASRSAPAAAGIVSFDRAVKHANSSSGEKGGVSRVAAASSASSAGVVGMNSPQCVSIKTTMGLREIVDVLRNLNALPNGIACEDLFDDCIPLLALVPEKGTDTMLSHGGVVFVSDQQYRRWQSGSADKESSRLQDLIVTALRGCQVL